MDYRHAPGLDSLQAAQAQVETVMPPVFADPETEMEFTRKGYVVLPFLKTHEIETARRLHDTLTPAIPSDLYQSVSGDTDYRKHVSDGISRIIQGRLKEL